MVTYYQHKRKGKIPDHKTVKNFKKSLLKYLLANLPKLSEEQKRFVIKAYKVAYDAHKGQERKATGEPYIVHPVEVAIIVGSEIGFGPTSIAAALLHDVVEDTKENPEPITLEDIEREFGKSMRIIIDGVTKITEQSGTKQSLQLGTFRNMIFKAAEDFRVLIIKISDRLHNMRTMEGMKENTQRIKSIENLEIYAKIAESAGLWQVKMELEDLSFRYLEPTNFELVKKASQKHDRNLLKETIDFKKRLNTVLPRYIDTETRIVRRSLYSIWRKMTKENIDYEKVFNIFSTRVVINVEDERIRKIAYDYFIDITASFPVRNQSLRDFIVAPKPNGFKALVFNIMYGGRWREIQILSKEGDEIATHGFVKKRQFTAPGIFRLKEEAHRIENETPDYLIDRFQELINPSQIRIFTPKGDLINIVKGATVADFAFKIHTDLGIHCKGAHIDNGKEIVPPNYVLKKSQQVEIITSDKPTINEDWLDFVKLPEFRRLIIKELNLKDNIDKPKDVTYNPNLEFSRKKTITISDKIEYQIANCCQPLYGEEIMVHRRADNLLIVHSNNCHNANNLRFNNAQNTAKAQWGDVSKHKSRKVKIHIRGYGKPGVLKNMIDIIADKMHLNMKHIYLTENNNIFDGEILICMWDYPTLELLINNLSKIPEITEVYRVLKKH